MNAQLKEFIVALTIITLLVCLVTVTFHGRNRTKEANLKQQREIELNAAYDQAFFDGMNATLSNLKITASNNVNLDIEDMIDSLNEKRDNYYNREVRRAAKTTMITKLKTLSTQSNQVTPRS